MNRPAITALSVAFAAAAVLSTVVVSPKLANAGSEGNQASSDVQTERWALSQRRRWSLRRRVNRLEVETSDLTSRVEDLEATTPPPFPKQQFLSSANVRVYVVPTISFSYTDYNATGPFPGQAIRVETCNWYGPNWDPYCTEAEPTDLTGTFENVVTADLTGPWTLSEGMPEFDDFNALFTNGELGLLSIIGHQPGTDGWGATSTTDQGLFWDYISPGDFDIKDKYTLHSITVFIDQFTPGENEDGPYYHVTGRVAFRIERLRE